MRAQGAHQLFVSAWLEQIHALQISQAFGHFTFFQPGRDNEDPALGKHIRFFKRDPQFLPAISTLTIEMTRKANDGHIAPKDRLADLILPIGTGCKALLVEPRLHRIFFQPRVQRMHRRTVRMGVAKEYFERTFFQG